MVPHNMVTTQFELDGFRVMRTLGVVRGITVRSRSIFGTIGARLQTIVGGNITLLTNLCERTRAEAFDLMLQHAAEIGGNAVVGARYDATEVMQGVTEVLAYGTAVFVEAQNEFKWNAGRPRRSGRARRPCLHRVISFRARPTPCIRSLRLRAAKIAPIHRSSIHPRGNIRGIGDQVACAKLPGTPAQNPTIIPILRAVFGPGPAVARPHA